MIACREMKECGSQMTPSNTTEQWVVIFTDLENIPGGAAFVRKIRLLVLANFETLSGTFS